MIPRACILIRLFGGSAFALAFFVLQRKYPDVYNSKMKINKDKKFLISWD